MKHMDKSDKAIVTPYEYAKLRGITHSAVSVRMKRTGKLPFVKEIQHYSRFYLLVLDNEYVNSLS